MKNFIKEIKSEWSHLRYLRTTTYAYSRNGLCWSLRSFLVGMNREVAKSITQLLYSPLTLFVCILSVIIAYLTINFVGRSDIITLLSNVMGLITTLVSVLIAAAIFISTVHQKNKSRSNEEDMLLKKQLLKSKFAFSEAYEELKSAISNEDRIILFKAAPAASVSNDYDYQQFKKWHKEAIGSIDTKSIQSYERSIFYPYDMVMEMRGMRTYYISEAAPIVLRLLEKDRSDKAKRLKAEIENLQAAAERYQTAGTHGSYVPTDFIGRHFMRIVVYCLLALAAITSSLLLQNYTANLLTYNVHIVELTLAMSIILSILALFLVLRHVFYFINYLRNNTEYSGTIFDNFYINDNDPSAKDPDTSYPYG